MIFIIQLFEIDKEWIDYERERNQIKTEISEMIFEDFVTEIAKMMQFKNVEEEL